MDSPNYRFTCCINVCLFYEILAFWWWLNLGDISEYRGLIIVFSFLGVFALLISSPIMDARFNISLVNMTQTETPSSKWEASTAQIGGYNTTFEYTLNTTGATEVDVDVWALLDVGAGDPALFGGHDIDIWYTEPNQTLYTHFIYFRHNFGFFSSDDMQIFSSSGIDITYLQAEPSIYDVLRVEDIDNYPLPFKIQYSHFYMTCDFYYNATTWTNATNALNHNELSLLLGINFDQFGASFDAWSLISKLMTFQPVDIPSPLNYILAFGLWGAIGYMVFIFVLRVIGAVFGGGGA